GSADDVLIGDAGSNELHGGAGDDTLQGGDVPRRLRADIVTDFAAGAGVVDVIEFHDGLFADFAAVLAASTASGDSTIITVDTSTTITLQHGQVSTFTAGDFRFV